MIKTRYLDLMKVELFGFESVKSRYVVNSIIEGITNGDEFPAVPVHEILEGYYVLSPIIRNPDGSKDGGHNRALGHFHARHPLKVTVFETPRRNKISQIIALPEIELVEDMAQFESRKRRFPQYRDIRAA